MKSGLKCTRYLSPAANRRLGKAVVLVAVCEAGHIDLATVALRRIAEPVRVSGATLSPDAVRHFAGILAKMGKLAGAR